MSLEKKIFTEKLHFRENATSKIRSFENIEHQPKSSDKQIYNEQLPWLRYNRPNLPEQIKDQINRKQYLLDNDNSLFTLNAIESEQEERSKNKRLYLPKLNDEKQDFKFLESSAKNVDTVDNETKKDVKQNSVKFNDAVRSELKNEATEVTTKNNDKQTNRPKANANIKPQKRDASTATEVPTLISVEVQTTTEPIKQQTKKLKHALKNSNTFENNYCLRPNINNCLQTSKPERSIVEQKEDLITSSVIDTFLPSISYNEKENKNRENRSYSYFNNRKNLNSKSTKFSPTKHPVTHAGIDFLDQYWAAQRWLMFNKDYVAHHREMYGSYNSFASNERSVSESEIPFVVNMKIPKPADQREKPKFGDLYTERVQYYTDGGVKDDDRIGVNIERISVKDLEKIIL